MYCETSVLSSLLHNEVFQTVISGLLLFIISQFILEIIIKPCVKLKRLKALLSEKLLLYQSKITNGNLSEEAIKEIKDASSKLLSFAWVFSFRKKKKFQFVDISQNVNGSVMASQSKNKSDLTFSIECLNNLKKYKFLKVTFE